MRNNGGNIAAIGKITIALVVLTIVIILVVVFTKKSRSKEKENKEYEKDLNEDIKGGSVTLSSARAKQIADSIYTAVKGFGTDEEAIYSALMNIKTNADFQYVVQKFGIRDDETMIQWLTGDLSSSERKQCNEILSGNGVTITI